MWWVGPKILWVTAGLGTYLGFSFLIFFFFFLLNLLQYCFCFMLWFFGYEAPPNPDQGLNPYPLHWKAKS